MCNLKCSFCPTGGDYSEISTNFSVKDYDDAYLETIVESRLSELKVSADGASQESYSKYRVKGEFERVVHNMKRLKEVKKACGSDLPHVTYKFLLNKFNQHEIEQAKELAEECGADFLLHENFWCPTELRDEWIADPVRDKYGELTPQGIEMRRGETIHTFCRQMWDWVIINANGDVYPCCLIYKPNEAVPTS